MVNSWPLMFEIPVFLRHFKFFRYLSFITAIIYDVIYFDETFGWAIELFMLPEDEYLDATLGDILMSMFLIYNGIIHFTIFINNLVIILKEIQLFIFQIGTHVGGHLTGF